MPLLVIMVTALFALGALVLDVGNVYASKQQAQDSADTAVLAKALDCVKATTTDLGPFMVQGSSLDPDHTLLATVTTR